MAIDCSAALSALDAFEDSELKRNVLINIEAGVYRSQRELDLDLEALDRDHAARMLKAARSAP